MKEIRLHEDFFAGEVVYNTGGTYGPVTQRHLQFVILHSGQGDHRIDGRRYLVEPGEVILLIPGETVFIRFSETEPSHHTWIEARSPKFALKPIRQQMEPRHRPLDGIAENILWLALGRAGQREKNPDLEHPANRPAVTLRDALCRSFFAHFLQPASAEPGPRGPIHPAVQRMSECFEQSLHEELDLPALARQCGVSAQHLMRLCQQAYGTSPMRLLWRERINRGLSLLRSTGLSISEIAYRTGFQTPEHFSRRIRQATGQSPRIYRQGHWGREG